MTAIMTTLMLFYEEIVTVFCIDNMTNIWGDLTLS